MGVLVFSTDQNLIPAAACGFCDLQISDWRESSEAWAQAVHVRGLSLSLNSSGSSEHLQEGFPSELGVAPENHQSVTLLCKKGPLTHLAVLKDLLLSVLRENCQGFERLFVLLGIQPGVLISRVSILPTVLTSPVDYQLFSNWFSRLHLVVLGSNSRLQYLVITSRSIWGSRNVGVSNSNLPNVRQVL